MSLKDQLRDSCDGSGACAALEHWHGCYSDITGNSCDEPAEHPAADVDKKRDAYTAARAWLAFLIDNPDKTVSVDAYKAQIRGARKAVADAHKAVMKGWEA